MSAVRTAFPLTVIFRTKKCKIIQEAKYKMAYVYVCVCVCVCGCVCVCVCVCVVGGGILQ